MQLLSSAAGAPNRGRSRGLEVNPTELLMLYVGRLGISGPDSIPTIRECRLYLT